MAKYYLAKLNITENIFTDDIEKIKLDRIPKRILSFKQSTMFYSVGHKISGEGKTKWTFSDVDQMDDDIISGNIAKQESIDRIEIKDGKSIVSTENNAKLVKFFYLVKEELLLVQSNADINSADSVIIFRQLLLLNDQLHLIGDVDVKLLTDQSHLINELMSKPVRQIVLNYRVPNDPKTINRVSDILLDAHAKTGALKMENPDGLESKENGKLSKVFSDITTIVSKGYGTWKAKVGNKKNSKIISSDSSPVTKNISDDALKSGMDVKAAVEEMKERVENTEKRQ